MERCEDDIGIIPFQQYYGNDFGLIDFMDEANLNQFIDLIRGEIINNQTDHDQPIFNYDQSNVADCHFLPPPPPPPSVELFDFDAGHVDNNPHEFGLLNINACQNQAAGEEEIVMGEDDDDDDDDDDDGDSSGSGNTTTTTTTTPRAKKGGGKADRSRTLVSERRRRGRMKEKLYALRSLVPNITKMDKASIVGDAVSYVQDLQMQAKKLRAEIAAAGGNHKHQIPSPIIPLTSFYPITNKKIFKMDVVEVEERGFYVRIVSNRAKGVAMLLYRALESLTTFDVRSSNLAAASAHHNYVFTFTLHTAQGESNVNLQSVKVWIASVFLNQGFEFQTSSSESA